MAALTSREIPLSSISPKYLHSNSTSHVSPFSAVAELIDNAYDPDVSAKQFWINKTVIKDQHCLIFMDNGKGMDYDKMYKMLSFGFSDKQTVRGHDPVGRYGNGFKSGSMRLGKDAIVFSKKDDTMCVGLLSQTYLEKIGAQNVIVPIAMFTKTKQTVSAAPEHAKCLHDILTHSIFQTKEELLSEFSIIDGLCANSSGTRIIIWNLCRTPLGELEFDFRKDPYDIQIPTDVYRSTRPAKPRQAGGGISVPESGYSLRAYCRILYLKPRMQIIIQDSKVEAEFITKTLAKVITDTYKPFGVAQKIIITFGYNTKNNEHYGLMMYHKNRLIKAYERVACQRKDNRGEGVIGVIECNHLTPTHNKQDFDRTEEYRNTITNVGKKLENYWNEVAYSYKQFSTEPFEDAVKKPDQIWVQCDECLKWRKLPNGIDPKLLPKNWFCRMNPDPQFRSCEVEEEPEDPDHEQPRNQHERYKKMLQKNRQKSTFTPTSSIQMTPRPSDYTSYDTQDTYLSTTPKRKEKDLDLCQEIPEKKKTRIKGFDINTKLNDDVDDVIDKCMVKKEASNQITKVTEAIRNLQDKWRGLKEVLKKEGVDIKMDSIESECMLSNCESLQNILGEIKTECENVEISAKDGTASSTEASNSGRGKDSHLRIWNEEKPLRLRELREKVRGLLVTFVPAMDLERVISEILTHFMNEVSPTEAHL